MATLPQAAPCFPGFIARCVDIHRGKPERSERNMGFTSSIDGYLELGNLHYMEVQHHNVMMRYDDLIIYDDI